MDAQFYLLTFRDTGVRKPDGEPLTVEDWQRLATHRANTLTKLGLGGMVRLGRPAFDAVAAQAAVLAEAHS